MIGRKIRLFLFSIILVFILVGCTKKEEASLSVSDEKISELETKMTKLEEELYKQQAFKEETEELIAKIQDYDELKISIQMLEESYLYVMNQNYVLDRLLQHTTTYKTAMLNSAKIIDDSLSINITYQDKVTDDEAPNGFRLVETSEGTKDLLIKGGVPILLQENPGMLMEATWEHVVDHRGFLQLFEKDGEVIFILESYIP
ncbi:hypothetical protein ACWE42_23420 [Sutcliffiella cohnii]